MSWIKKSITRKTGVAVLLIIVLFSAVYYYFLNVELRNYFEQQSRQQLLSASEYVSSGIEMFLQKYLTIAEQAKDNPDFITISEEISDRYKKRENPLYDRVTKELQNISALDDNIAMSYIALSKANDLVTNIYDYESIPDIIWL